MTYARVILVGLMAGLLWPKLAVAGSLTDDERAQARGLIERALRPGGEGTTPQAPGLSVAIGIQGEPVMVEGFGEAAPGEPAKADTRYRIGSLTKQFTAAAVLELVEAGAVSTFSGKTLTLDIAGADLFPGVEAWTVAGQNPITLRSLLNMTSNLPNFTRRPPIGTNPWGKVDAGHLLTAIKAQSPSGWPNSFEYSNTSYFLAAEAIESLSIPGQGGTTNYRQILTSTLFPRAEMVATGFAGDAADASSIAKPAFKRRPAFAESDWLKGSGDIVSTAPDLLKWDAALMSGKILSPAMLNEMFKEGGRIAPTTSYGMGWVIAEQSGWNIYSHTGSVAGYTSCNAIARRSGGSEWISVTLLTNSDGVEGLDLLAEDLLRLARSD
ncbi:MAG: serine hydrolase domain-containing protein [Hyphomicrobium sp.]